MNDEMWGELRSACAREDWSEVFELLGACECVPEAVTYVMERLARSEDCASVLMAGLEEWSAPASVMFDGVDDEWCASFGEHWHAADAEVDEHGQVVLMPSRTPSIRAQDLSISIGGVELRDLGSLSPAAHLRVRRRQAEETTPVEDLEGTLHLMRRDGSHLEEGE